jgi:hypothetical protein
MTRKPKKPIRLKRRSVRKLDEHALEKADGGRHAPVLTEPTWSCGCVETVRYTVNHNQQLRRSVALTSRRLVRRGVAP